MFALVYALAADPSDRRARRLAKYARYRKSAKGRARTARYDRSAKGKARTLRYAGSEKGRAANARYDALPQRARSQAALREDDPLADAGSWPELR